jgi:hypothetical protein
MPATRSLLVFVALFAPGAALAEAPLAPEKPPLKVAKSRPPRCVMAPIDLAVTPRISLNRLRAACSRNLLGIALGGSRAGELRGLQIAIGVNGVERSAIGAQVAIGVNGVGEDSAGLQLAGLVNASGGSFTGVQLAGLINAAGEDITAIQVAGLINASGEDVTALQIAGLGNATGGETTGLQASLLFNATGDHLRGAQVTGLFNAAGESVRAFQFAGLFNAAGEDARGVQIAGLFNAVGEEARVIQISGLFNAAGQLRGAQVAGAMNATGDGTGLQAALAYNRADKHLAGVQVAAVNVAGDIEGAQLGLVNVARRVRGVQLGLVNVADQADVPIGAVSWVRRGERALEAWGTEALIAAGLRLGTERVYSLAGLASGPLVDGAPWGPVAGAGVRGGLGRIDLMFDALAHALFFDGIDDQALLAQVRARAAYELNDWLALSAGPTWNVFVSGDVDGADLPLGGDSLDRSGDTAVRQWPGFTGGAALRW